MYIQTVEHLLECLMEGRTGHQYDFGGDTLHLTSDCSWRPASDCRPASGLAGTLQDFSERQPVKDIPVRAELFCGGGTVSNATLNLGNHGVVALLGTCDIEFKNVVFLGETSHVVALKTLHIYDM